MVAADVAVSSFFITVCRFIVFLIFIVNIFPCDFSFIFVGYWLLAVNGDIFIHSLFEISHTSWTIFQRLFFAFFWFYCQLQFDVSLQKDRRRLYHLQTIWFAWFSFFSSLQMPLTSAMVDITRASFVSSPLVDKDVKNRI